MSKYCKYIISTEPFLPDILSGILWQLNISGIDENENSISVYAKEESNVNEIIIRNELDKIVNQNLILDYTVASEIIEDKNWNEIWEMSREVIRISKKIVIKPSFKDYNPVNNEIVITIDPKMSFGTGEHESTKLVIHLLEKYVQKDDKLFDVGSGTGILSIAGLKLGAKYAVAVDNDKLCFENCVENCSINGVEEKIEVVEGIIDNIDKNDFDLIVANIQKNVLLEIANQIKQRVKKGGRIILSGLMIEDEEEIILKYESLGCIKIETRYLNDWIAIVFRIK